jgi:hypothetical protein
MQQKKTTTKKAYISNDRNARVANIPFEDFSPPSTEPKGAKLNLAVHTTFALKIRR